MGKPHVITQDHRGLEINKRTCKGLLIGAIDLYLDVYDGNEVAVRVYEKVGFVKSLVDHYT